jgi:hypothetical protein
MLMYILHGPRPDRILSAYFSLLSGVLLTFGPHTEPLLWDANGADASPPSRASRWSVQLALAFFVLSEIEYWRYTFLGPRTLRSTRDIQFTDMKTLLDTLNHWAKERGHTFFSGLRAYRSDFFEFLILLGSSFAITLTINGCCNYAIMQIISGVEEANFAAAMGGLNVFFTSRLWWHYPLQWLLLRPVRLWVKILGGAWTWDFYLHRDRLYGLYAL